MVPFINWVVSDMMMTVKIKQNYEKATSQLWLYPPVPVNLLRARPHQFWHVSVILLVHGF